MVILSKAAGKTHSRPANEALMAKAMRRIKESIATNVRKPRVHFDQGFADYRIGPGQTFIRFKTVKTKAGNVGLRRVG